MALSVDTTGRCRQHALHTHAASPAAALSASKGRRSMTHWLYLTCGRGRGSPAASTCTITQYTTSGSSSSMQPSGTGARRLAQPAADSSNIVLGQRQLQECGHAAHLHGGLCMPAAPADTPATTHRALTHTCHKQHMVASPDSPQRATVTGALGEPPCSTPHRIAHG